MRTVFNAVVVARVFVDRQARVAVAAVSAMRIALLKRIHLGKLERLLGGTSTPMTGVMTPSCWQGYPPQSPQSRWAYCPARVTG